jgi:lipopolysaccharide/colanic/teichoic acid biosynthesis glycosyltransferase
MKLSQLNGEVLFLNGDELFWRVCIVRRRLISPRTAVERQTNRKHQVAEPENIASHSEEVSLSAKPFVSGTFEPRAMHEFSPSVIYGGGDASPRLPPAQKPGLTARPSLHLPLHLLGRLSPWSRSGAKRFFDCACVLSMLPLLVPLMLAIALAVRLTSSGPIHFLQKRMGRHGRTFTILKFRTLIHAPDKSHHAVTTACNQQFTPVGSFLRRWKLDELPQLLNVLAGHMSLVGPRPKLPEHVVSNPSCRPGITGAATIVFAREELILAHVPKDQLDAFYHEIVLPAKRSLDAVYMAHATFLSDLKLIVNSALRRWDSSVVEDLLSTEVFGATNEMQGSRRSDPTISFIRMPLQHNVDESASVEQLTAL